MTLMKIPYSESAHSITAFNHLEAYLFAYNISWKLDKF